MIQVCNEDNHVEFSLNCILYYLHFFIKRKRVNDIFSAIKSHGPDSIKLLFYILTWLDSSTGNIRDVRIIYITVSFPYRY